MINDARLDIKKQVEKAITILKQGGVIAYPTDTVYGLGANAYDAEAAKRVYQIKGRPASMPFPLLVADKDQLNEMAEAIPTVGRVLIDRFLPGALTIVVVKSTRVPDFVTAGSKTVGLRIPAHSITKELIKGLGSPLIGTSANLTGKPSSLTAEEVRAQLGGRVDLIIDGGKTPGGRESTVIDVTGEKPLILRESAISKETLENTCKCKFLKKGEVD